MTHSHQNSLPVPMQTEKQRELIHASSELISEDSPLAAIRRTLLAGPNSRRRRKEFHTGALQEAQRVNETALQAASDNLQLMIEVVEQTQQDELRIGHRHVMNEISTEANSQLHESIRELYVSKKRELQTIEGLQGDSELIALAAQYLAEITDESAKQLIDRNTKPR